MATPLLGQLEQFDLNTDDWLQYVERMEQMFAANDLTGEAKAEKRRSIFLAVVGKRVYGILRSLLAPERPATGGADGHTHKAFQSTSIRSHLEIQVLRLRETARRVCVCVHS